MFRSAPVEPDALAHVPDADVLRFLRSAERDVARKSATAFALTGENSTPRRRSMARARIDTACEARDRWFRVAVARDLPLERTGVSS